MNRWIIYHAPEITAVGLPTALAVAWSWWWALAAFALATVWAWQEVAVARAVTSQAGQAPAPRDVTAVPTHQQADSSA